MTKQLGDTGNLNTMKGENPGFDILNGKFGYIKKKKKILVFHRDFSKFTLQKVLFARGKTGGTTMKYRIHEMSTGGVANEKILVKKKIKVFFWIFLSFLLFLGWRNYHYDSSKKKENLRTENC